MSKRTCQFPPLENHIQQVSSFTMGFWSGKKIWQNSWGEEIFTAHRSYLILCFGEQCYLSCCLCVFEGILSLVLNRNWWHVQKNERQKTKTAPPPKTSQKVWSLVLCGLFSFLLYSSWFPIPQAYAPYARGDC